MPSLLHAFVRAALLSALLGVSLGGVARVSAQDAATPAATSSCNAADQSPDWFLEAYRDVEPRERPATPSFEALPEGDPVEADLEATFNDLLANYLTCTHERDLLRVGSLVTPGFFVTRYQNLTLAELAAPIPADGVVPEWTLSEFRLMDDGGVGALLDIGPAAAPEAEGSNQVRFVDQGGTWLIDDIVASAG